MKEKSNQIKRLEKTILSILNQSLITEFDDQCYRQISFTDVKLSNDKSWLTVYVDQFGHQSNQVVIDNLNKVKGWFKKILAQKLTIYRIPEITFVYDDLIEQANKIEALIDQSLKRIKK
ncbi:Ribosome-binding factor RbfA [[Mycoplasma] cavipharyngis]|uniref:30S ribosome-binding factor RbfA n=1 Tax=[Mycoplasma] cavipharyngis TaxID=92757 RepID=UPI00370464D3